MKTIILLMSFFTFTSCFDTNYSNINDYKGAVVLSKDLNEYGQTILVIRYHDNIMYLKLKSEYYDTFQPKDTIK